MSGFVRNCVEEERSVGSIQSIGKHPGIDVSVEVVGRHIARARNS